MFFSAHFRGLSAGKKAALLAVFIALSIVVNCFSVDVGTSNKIAFTYAVCFFAGYLMGGLPAFGIAFIGDAVGYLINPVGVYWLFGVTLGVYAFLMGAVMNAPVGNGRAAAYIKAAAALAIGYLLVTVLLNSAVNYLYVKIFIWEGEAREAFLVYLGGRLAFQSIVYAVNLAVCMALLPVLLQIRFRTRAGRKKPVAGRGEHRA